MNRDIKITVNIFWVSFDILVVRYFIHANFYDLDTKGNFKTVFCKMLLLDSFCIIVWQNMNLLMK